MSRKTSRARKPSLRTFLVKLNSDAAFRARFLEDPVAHLGRYGITLDVAAKREVRRVAKEINQKLPALGKTPSGFVILFEEEITPTGVRGIAAAGPPHAQVSII